MTRHGTISDDCAHEQELMREMNRRLPYSVYCYSNSDDVLGSLDYIFFATSRESAVKLADYAVSDLACYQSKVVRPQDDGTYEDVYETTNPVTILAAFARLLGLSYTADGDILPDPEDSPFFDTPSEPMAAV